MRPQEAKNKKRRASQRGGLEKDKSQRDAALRGIREQFNPFESRPARREKHNFFRTGIDKAVEERLGKQLVGRPGVKKGYGEENVRG